MKEISSLVSRKMCFENTNINVEFVFKVSTLDNKLNHSKLQELSCHAKAIKDDSFVE